MKAWHQRLTVIVLALVAIAVFVAAGRESGRFAAPAIDESSNTAITPSVGLAVVADHSTPVEVIDWPGRDLSLVVELTGRVVTLGSPSEVVVDVTAYTLVDGELGLLGAAMHPTGELLYVHHSDLDGNSAIVEYQIASDALAADPATRRIVMTIEQPFENHNGGEIAFGPDGYLYIGLGDGGLADDPVRSALDLSSPLGKILRVDPTRPHGEAGYTVPSDNPFVGVAGADDRIWAYGLRNPWKFSFSPIDSSVWIADVGQHMAEEVNVVPTIDGELESGLSFGWSAYEGLERFNEDQPADGHTEPWLTMSHDDGNCSISGGAVHDGASVPSLAGWYVFGDYCTGIISAVPSWLESPESSDIVTLGRTDALVAIATGADGRLFAVSAAGPVMEIVAN